MPLTKRKISVSLDEDLIAELEAVGLSISAQINSAVRADLQRRWRRRRLTEMLDQIDAEQGPVDEGLVQKYVELLQ